MQMLRWSGCRGLPFLHFMDVCALDVVQKHGLGMFSAFSCSMSIQALVFASNFLLASKRFFLQAGPILITAKPSKGAITRNPPPKIINVHPAPIPVKIGLMIAARTAPKVHRKRLF